jgi:hypothetical protein
MSSQHPAGWRMPTELQLERPSRQAAAISPSKTPGPADDMPLEYWQAVLADQRAASEPSKKPIQTRRLGDIEHHVLRVTCRRCDRTIEIQRADAVRLYGPDALWKQVGQRLLDDTCQERTGRYEEDGCWPAYE